MTDDVDNPITRFRPWLRSSAKAINHDQMTSEPDEEDVILFERDAEGKIVIYPEAFKELG